MFGWPLRRKRSRADSDAPAVADALGPAPAATDSDPAPVADGPGPRQRPAWRWLPALRLTTSPVAPMTLDVGPAGVLDRLRPDPPPLGRSGQAGQVAGIVVAIPVVDDSPDVVVGGPRVAMPVRRPVVRGPRQAVGPFTEATEEWVAEPRIPEKQLLPSEFMHKAYGEKDRFLAEEYTEAAGEPPPVPQPLRPPAHFADVDTLSPTPPVVRRRATLAASRRLGLGAEAETEGANADERIERMLEPDRPSATAVEPDAPVEDASLSADPPPAAVRPADHAVAPHPVASPEVATPVVGHVGDEPPARQVLRHAPATTGDRPATEPPRAAQPRAGDAGGTAAGDVDQEPAGQAQTTEHRHQPPIAPPRTSPTPSGEPTRRAGVDTPPAVPHPSPTIKPMAIAPPPHRAPTPSVNHKPTSHKPASQAEEPRVTPALGPSPLVSPLSSPILVGAHAADQDAGPRADPASAVQPVSGAPLPHPPALQNRQEPDARPESGAPDPAGGPPPGPAPLTSSVPVTALGDDHGSAAHAESPSAGPDPTGGPTPGPPPPFSPLTSPDEHRPGTVPDGPRTSPSPTIPAVPGPPLVHAPLTSQAPQHGHRPDRQTATPDPALHPGAGPQPLLSPLTSAAPPDRQQAGSDSRSSSGPDPAIPTPSHPPLSPTASATRADERQSTHPDGPLGNPDAAPHPALNHPSLSPFTPATPPDEQHAHPDNRPLGPDLANHPLLNHPLLNHPSLSPSAPAAPPDEQHAARADNRPSSPESAIHPAPARPPLLPPAPVDGQHPANGPLGDPAAAGRPALSHPPFSPSTSATPPDRQQAPHADTRQADAPGPTSPPPWSAARPDPTVHPVPGPQPLLSPLTSVTPLDKQAIQAENTPPGNLETAISPAPARPLPLVPLKPSSPQDDHEPAAGRTSEPAVAATPAASPAVGDQPAAPVLPREVQLIAPLTIAPPRSPATPGDHEPATPRPDERSPATPATGPVHLIPRPIKPGSPLTTASHATAEHSAAPSGPPAAALPVSGLNQPTHRPRVSAPEPGSAGERPGMSTPDSRLDAPAPAGGTQPALSGIQLAPNLGHTLSALTTSVVESFVPPSLAAPLRRALSIDTSDVTVRRGPAVGQVAHRMGARGFTQGGVVHVPDSAGALDSSSAAPLLAHELTHVAQQRRFGAALPEPGSAEGQRLEAEAVAVEQWYAQGASGEPPALGHLPQVKRRPRSRTEHVLPDRLPEAVARPALTLAAAKDLWREEKDAATPDFWQLPEATALPEVSMDGLKRLWQENQDPQQADFWDTDDTDDADQRPDVSMTGLMNLFQQGRQARERGSQEDGEPTGDAPLSIEDIKDELADDPPLRWMNLDDPDDFDELADRLYNALTSRLRFDVLVERERSGTLLDFG
ncbi:eCIS core domain-containing protein [Actinokineospora sp. 24-640]